MEKDRGGSSEDPKEGRDREGTSGPSQVKLQGGKLTELTNDDVETGTRGRAGGIVRKGRGKIKGSQSIPKRNYQDTGAKQNPQQGCAVLNGEFHGAHGDAEMLTTRSILLTVAGNVSLSSGEKTGI